MAYRTAFRNKLSSNSLVSSQASLILDRILNQHYYQAGESSKLVGADLRAKFVPIFEHRNETYFHFLDAIANRLVEVFDRPLPEHWDEFDLSFQDSDFVPDDILLTDNASDRELAVLSSLRATSSPRIFAQLEALEEILMSKGTGILDYVDFEIVGITSEQLSDLFKHLRDLKDIYHKDNSAFDEIGMSMALV